MRLCALSACNSQWAHIETTESDSYRGLWDPAPSCHSHPFPASVPTFPTALKPRWPAGCSSGDNTPKLANTPSLTLSPARCPSDRLFPGTEITAQTTPPWEGFSEHLTVPLPTPFPLLLFLPLWHSIIPLTFLSACLPLQWASGRQGPLAQALLYLCA